MTDLRSREAFHQGTRSQDRRRRARAVFLSVPAIKGWNVKVDGNTAVDLVEQLVPEDDGSTEAPLRGQLASRYDPTVLSGWRLCW